MFNLNDGQNCCINEHGATLISGTAGWLTSAVDFEAAGKFRVAETATGRLRTVSRAELERMASGTAAASGSSARKRHSLLQLTE